jgi:hypothetical protein
LQTRGHFDMTGRRVSFQDSPLETPPRPGEITPLTVCIVAMCEGGIVLGASDRMITWGDIQFQPPTPKLVVLTSSIAAMTSGDATLLREISNGVQAEVKTAIATTPNEWLTVSEVADMFVRHRNEAKLRRAEAALLGPLGLNRYSFLQGQHGLSADLAQTIAKDLAQFPINNTIFLITGVDLTGPHIYTVFDGVVSCNDAMAFAAIGSGARHAESHFMLARHGCDRTLSETLLQIHVAKKRAEIAPGVGSETDMFSIGSGLGTFVVLNDTVIERLDTEYQQLVGEEQIARDAAKRRVDQYVDELRGTPAPTQQPDPEAIGDGLEAIEPASEHDADVADTGA